MIFTKRLRDGVRRGEITCSIRIWTRPHVKAGNRYRMEEGEIEVESVLPITLADITPELARESGFKGVVDLLKVAKHGRGENVYLVRFHYVPPRAKRSRGRALVVVAALLASAASSRADAQWIEAKSAHVTVFSQAGYAEDVEFTRRWLDRADQLIKNKYGTTADGYRMSVYLLPAPGGDIDTNQSGQLRCCTSAADGTRTGTIRLLTRSAPVWKAAPLKSSLGLLKSGDDYHAKVLMAEYIPIGHYAAQDSRPSDGWKYYSAPEWFVQGLQEYDAIYHTTDDNRTSTAQRLLQWAKSHSTSFACCAPGLAIADAHNGGATFLAFLAAEFGEDVHARLLRSPASTFDAAFASVTEPHALPALFERFRKWLDSREPGATR